MYRPYHLIGLELAISVLNAGLRREATGTPAGFRADVVATAKRELTPGEVLDGEGGYAAHGVLMGAAAARAADALPIGLSGRAVVERPVAKGELVRRGAVTLHPSSQLLEELRDESLAPAD